MVRMLLVEDESYERASLRSCIDWGLVGVEIVDEAANGAQGLAKVLETKPDIVLTDVKMPVMDGIEMSQKIRTIAPDTKILFISSYDNFEYARQAVNLNAAAYVTKPVNEGELLRLVKRAADEITEKELEKKLANKIKTHYNTSVLLARQAVVNRAVTGLPVSAEEAGQLGLAWLCGPLSNPSVMLGLFDREKTDAVDSRLGALNRRTAEICPNSVSACVNAGVMVTIAALDGAVGDEPLGRLRDAVLRFFAESGCEGARLECASGNGAALRPAQLYLQLLQKNVAPNSPDSYCAAEKKSKQQIVDEVVQIIRSQYHTDLSIESIARSLHFTPNYIGTVFKSMQKVGITRYLNTYRLERARELLGGKGDPIGDIAELCGYDNITYFYTMFKKEYGVTPSEYRQSVQGA